MVQHTGAGAMTLAFMACCDIDGGFPKQLSSRIEGVAPLLAVRIGGLINFMGGQYIVSPSCMVSEVQGEYPNNRPLNGNYPMAVGGVKAGLKQMMLMKNLEAVLSTVIGIQNDMLMLGFDKVIGAGNTTLRETYGKYKAANTAWNANGTVDPIKRAKQIKEAIRNQRGTLPDIFINLM